MELKNKVNRLKLEVKDYLMENLDKLEPVEQCENTFEYKIKIEDDYERILIWISNGEDGCRFYHYDVFLGLKIDFDEIQTEQEGKILWKKYLVDKENIPIKREIEMQTLSRDLFFSFNGVDGEVKFSGYNDSDWWNKYKPTEIKEGNGAKWKLDYDEMVAIYIKK